MKIVKWLLALGLLAGIGGVGFLYSGLYPMGADVPHNRLTYWALETLRERSIARAIRDIEVPSLDDPQQLISGGADYNDMCTGCHLKPGKRSSEMREGLYPQPPNLAMSADTHHHAGGDAEAPHGDATTSAARQFWIIKHGIKASGMAAFGPTHDDARIWSMVAFLQKLPALNEVQYQILTSRSPGDSGHGSSGHDGATKTAPAALEAESHAGHAH